MSDVVGKIIEYEKAGFTREQSVEIVKIERLVAINNRLKELNDSVQNLNERT